MTEVESRFTGTILEPGHEGYDEARRVFNGLVDRKSDRIMRCTSTRRSGRGPAGRGAGSPISVYGGGHGVTGAAVVDRGVVHRPSRP